MALLLNTKQPVVEQKLVPNNQAPVEPPEFLFTFFGRTARVRLLTGTAGDDVVLHLREVLAGVNGAYTRLADAAGRAEDLEVVRAGRAWHVESFLGEVNRGLARIRNLGALLEDTGTETQRNVGVPKALREKAK